METPPVTKERELYLRQLDHWQKSGVLATISEARNAKTAVTVYRRRIDADQPCTIDSLEYGGERVSLTWDADDGTKRFKSIPTQRFIKKNLSLFEGIENPLGPTE